MALSRFIFSKARRYRLQNNEKWERTGPPMTPPKWPRRPQVNIQAMRSLITTQKMQNEIVDKHSPCLPAFPDEPPPEKNASHPSHSSGLPKIVVQCWLLQAKLTSRSTMEEGAARQFRSPTTKILASAQIKTRFSNIRHHVESLGLKETAVYNEFQKQRGANRQATQVQVLSTS